MIDKNENNIIDPDEAEETVAKEGIVSGAFIEEKITHEKVAEIDTLEELSEEAENIEIATRSAEEKNVPLAPKISSEDVDLPEQQEEEKDSHAPTVKPAEVAQEISQETTSEATQETSMPSEISKETKSSPKI